MNFRIIVAIRITRSRIGMAVFVNEKVDFARCFNLPCLSANHAANSLRGLLNWMMEHFKDPAIALEIPQVPATPLITELYAMAKQRGLPIITVAFDALLCAY